MTLVELVIAISIIILISTLCFPKYNIEKYQVNSFTKQLCSDIRYVRRSNMLGNTQAYILWAEDNNRIGYTLRENEVNVKQVLLPKNVKIERSTSKIVFKGDGSPNPKGGTIRIFNDKFSKEITIVPISGRVLLKEGKYET